MNELICCTKWDFNKKTSMPVVKTICRFKEKTYKREIYKKGKTERDALNDIINYLVNKGHEIDNISYPELKLG